MRLAMRDYRPYVYGPGGPVWGSLSGLAGGRTCWEPELEKLEENWLCARFSVHDALVWGRVLDPDPMASDPLVVTRGFEGPRYRAVVAARPDCQEPFSWPDRVSLANDRAPFTVSLPHDAADVKGSFVCDLETLKWARIQPVSGVPGLTFRINTNWALMVLPAEDGPEAITVSELSSQRPGARTMLSIAPLTAKDPKARPLSVEVIAPGLQVTPSRARLPADVEITIPEDALPGLYTLQVTGDHVFGAQRFIHVE